MFTEAYLEQSWTSTMEHFFLWLSHILKTFNSIKLPLRSIFYTTHPYMKKLTTVKTLREKVFCKQWSNFFSKFEIRQWNGVVTKKWIEVLKLASVRSACVCIVFFFQYFKYYGQNIFSRTTVSYLIAKVERKQ